jgi:hypothetical protein
MEKLKLNGKFQAHQGDVEIFSIEELPKSVKVLPKTFFAKSEKSGHCHALCGDYELMECPDIPEAFLVKVGSDGATLNHTRLQNLNEEYWNKNQVTEVADHKPTILNKGLYVIGIQKRKKHFSKQWEKVLD